MIILGVWDGHDAGAALIDDGVLAAAVNEERFSRRKLEVRFPWESIAECLKVAGLAPTDVHVVAGSTTDPAKTLSRWFPESKERYYALRRRKTAPGWSTPLIRRIKYRLTTWRSSAVTAALSRRAFRRDLARAGVRTERQLLFEHHHCHAVAAAVLLGGASGAVLTIDGVGDGVSSATSHFRDGVLKRVRSSPASSSLGVFFEHVTTLLNMRELEDEGKVMALAEYAAPVDDAENPLLELIAVVDGQIQCTRSPHGLFEALRSLHWHFANEQFAAMAQRVVERVSIDLARDALSRTGERRLALAGGVASNIKATRLIRHLETAEAVHVFPHMGDGGLAVGAAIAGAQTVNERLRLDFSRLDFGPSFSDTEAESALHAAGLPTPRPDNLPAAVVDLLLQDRVVLWVQGRMEYGPRALGHRSVLARPDRQELRDRLNRVLKRRVWYQPFCPSLLASEAPSLLEDWDGRSNVHMTTAYMVAPDWRDVMAGVIGIDGSCRPQIVPNDASTPFAALLREMRGRWRAGVVLNTSLNIHGEPLVCRPIEAIDVYLRSHADALALGPYLIVRGRDGR